VSTVPVIIFIATWWGKPDNAPDWPRWVDIRSCWSHVGLGSDYL